MKDENIYKINDLSGFKISITDFIYQETFRFAMHAIASDEIKKIKILYSELKNNLKKFDSIYDYKHIEELANLATDLIVQGCNDSHFKKSIKRCISNKYYAEQEFEWLRDDSWTKEQEQNRIDIYKKTFSDIESVYKEYSNVVWTISTRYPPHFLAYEQDYDSTLEYIFKKGYLTKISTIKDDIFNENKENPCEITTLHIQSEPYEVFTPKRRNIIEFEYIFDELKVPEHAISKKLSYQKFRQEKLTECNLNNLIQLNFLNPEHDPKIYKSIRINIDLSLPIDDRELVQALTLIRNEICIIQSNNRLGKMLLAMTLDELDKAASIQKLEYLEYIKLMEIFSSQPQNNFHFNKFKLIVAGLMVYREYLINEDNQESLLNIRLSLSEKLTPKFGMGFSEKNIERGYGIVKKLIENQLEELKENF